MPGPACRSGHSASRGVAAVRVQALTSAMVRSAVTTVPPPVGLWRDRDTQRECGDELGSVGVELVEVADLESGVLDDAADISVEIAAARDGLLDRIQSVLPHLDARIRGQPVFDEVQ